MFKHEDLIRLLNILEYRYALRVLWTLRDGNPQSFRQLQSSVGGAAANSINARVKELRCALLVKHDERGYCVTALGASLLEHLAGVEAFVQQFPAGNQIR